MVHPPCSVAHRGAIERRAVFEIEQIAGRKSIRDVGRYASARVFDDEIPFLDRYECKKPLTAPGSGSFYDIPMAMLCVHEWLV